MADDWRWHAAGLSVVIPTYNRVDLLLRVLEAFQRQTLPADRFEVLVVDDGGTDGTAERVAALAPGWPFALRLLRQTNQGPAAARNAGLRAATHEIVVFVDDDCVPTPELLASHLARHEVEGLVTIGRITWHPELAVTPFLAYIQDDLFSYQNVHVGYDATFFCFFTGNASVHRASALAAGGFDVTFPYAMNEDIEFAYRLRRHGLRFVFAPEAVVWHARPIELGPALETQRKKGRELIRLWQKHPELRAFVPIERASDPAVRTRFYGAALDFFLMLGLQEGLEPASGLDPEGTVRALLQDEAQRWADRRVVALEEEVAALRAELASARRDQAWAAEVSREYAKLERAHARLAAWAADLELQARARGWRGLLARAAGGGQPAPAATPSLDEAILAQRRAAAADGDLPTDRS